MRWEAGVGGTERDPLSGDAESQFLRARMAPHQRYVSARAVFASLGIVGIIAAKVDSFEPASSTFSMNLFIWRCQRI